MFVGQKSLELIWWRQQSNYVEVNAAGVYAIGDRRRGADMMLGEVRLKKPVNGVGGFWAWWNIWPSRFQIIGFETTESKVFIPWKSLINPRAKRSDLIAGEARTFLWHDT